MLYLLFGPDTFRLRTKLKELVDKYKSRFSGLNFIRLNFKKNDFNDFKNFIETSSMFKEKKLIVVEDIFLEPRDFQEKILDYLKKKKLDTNQDILLVFLTREEVEFQNKLFQFLNKKAKVWQFNFLNEAQLKHWIQERFNEEGFRISDLAIKKLIEYVGNDLWRMYNEVEKLKAYKNKEKRVDKKIINIEDVNLLVKPEIDLNIFELIDALAQKNKKKALKLLEDGFKKGIDEGYLLNRFIYQFRNILKVKTFLKDYPELKNNFNLVAQRLGLHPFVAKKTISQVKNFTFDELKKIYQKLFEIDLGVKTSKVNPKTVLELFIAEL